MYINYYAGCFSPFKVINLKSTGNISYKVCHIDTIFNTESLIMALKFDTVEALLTDEGFQKWYFRSDPSEVEAWEKRLATDQSLKNLADEAAQLLGAIRIQEDAPDQPQVMAAKSRLMKSLNKPRATSKLISFRNRRPLWIAAAVATLILTSLAIVLIMQPARSNIITGYGEITQQMLPDGSIVTLNANSSIQYSNWRSGSDRELWIKGEGYFNVQKTTAQNKFIVHSGPIDVIVTGTSFNVHNRNNRTNVLLKEGNVMVRSESGAEEKMIPGEFIVHAGNGKLERKPAKDAQVTAWLERRFIFEKTPLKEVATAVTDIYGVPVKFDNAISTESITGILPNDNLDIFLQSLEATGNFDIDNRDGQILIRTRR